MQRSGSRRENTKYECFSVFHTQDCLKQAKAIYANLSTSDVDSVTFLENACLAINAFSALMARTNQVKRLRQTVINLVIRGKIITQSSADKIALQMLKKTLKKPCKT